MSHNISVSVSLRPSTIDSHTQEAVSSIRKMEHECESLQLIDGQGNFNRDGLQMFVKEDKLANSGISYAVVSIMGPQSSGKSTLLNHLFRTKFMEMDEMKGRSQTTQGIWVARGAEIEPCTLVMDLEGTDGQEREDDTTFEKQSALFALAVSDILLINMWCSDVGRENASNKPLLKCVFKSMLQLFGTRRKLTLMFIIRDKSKTPLDMLEKMLQEFIQKIWKTIPKPPHVKSTQLSDFFNILVEALCGPNEKDGRFELEVASLRKRFFYSTTSGGLAEDRSGELVSNVRCQAITEKCLIDFRNKKLWCELEKDAKQGATSTNFGRKIRYDTEASYFDEGIASAKRVTLEQELLQLVRAPVFSVLENLHRKIIEDFKEVLEKAMVESESVAAAVTRALSFIVRFDVKLEDAEVPRADWDTSNIKKKFLSEMEEHIKSVLMGKLRRDLEGHVIEALERADEHTWCQIKEHLLDEMQQIDCVFHLEIFEWNQHRNELREDFETCAKKWIKSEASQAAKQAPSLMRQRFGKEFNSGLAAAGWKGVDGIKEIVRQARSASLKTLSVMAIERLEDFHDNVEDTLSCFHDGLNINGVPNSTTWDGIPPKYTLITPTKCQLLLENFWEETEVVSDTTIAVLYIVIFDIDDGFDVKR
ncbi:ROOT HAIR DEFECTIVE 3-like protein [Drosera capensis]